MAKKKKETQLPVERIIIKYLLILIILYLLFLIITKRTVTPADFGFFILG